MKRVEANTAPAGIKNRRRQQVIYIHKHGRQENEVDPRPPFFEEWICDNAGEYQVQKIMYQWLHVLEALR